MIRKYLSDKIGKDAFRIKWNGDKRGDYSTNVGSPEKAEKIKKELSDSEYISKIETDNGFVNFFLSEKALEEGVANTCDSSYLLSLGKKQKIQVEFISANPTGPLTLGNGRGGVYGDVLANVLREAGFDVTKEYYVNDAGNQVEILGHSVLKDDKAEYQGEYIDALRQCSGSKDPKIVGEKSADIILESIKETVKEMGIDFDVWFSERKDLREKGKVEEIIKWFKEKDLAYEKDGALWFKASEFSDTEDRVLIKKNGGPTYFGVDCAYHKNKFEERKFDKVINVWGADHHGDVARVEGFVEALGHEDKLKIVLMQFVRLVEDGKSVRMSKREGRFVLVDDVLKEVGKDAFRYFMLTRSPDTHMDFDMKLAMEQSKKNPVYYIQYAGARMSSILEKAGKKAESLPDRKFFDKFVPQFCGTKPIRQSSKNFNPARNYERALILKLIQFPEVIEDVAKDYQVHQLTTYIYELARTFTDFYENVRVLDIEAPTLAKSEVGVPTPEGVGKLKEARLALVVITRHILERVLFLMGISSPKKM